MSLVGGHVGIEAEKEKEEPCHNKNSFVHPIDPQRR